PEPQIVGDYEMASRLSYFLWGTMPDQVLFDLAAKGQLHESDILKKQIARMLDRGAPRVYVNGMVTKAPEAAIGRYDLLTGGPYKFYGDYKGRAFSERFVDQWLGARELLRNFRPDPKLFPEYDAELRSAIRYEPILFFEEIVSQNLSL